MDFIQNILTTTEHREYPYPNQPWRYYQEWNKALFLHWEVPYEILREMVPRNLNIDTFNGKAYVSIVPFTMENIRPKFLPAVGFISNFHEINVRTYVEHQGKKGVYFLNIEAEKYLSALISKQLSGLPYEKAEIHRTDSKYTSTNSKKNYSLDADFSIGQLITNKTELELWLTERYCLYLTKNNDVYRYDIHHKEWELNEVKMNQLDVNCRIRNLILNNQNYFAHYSKGIKVIAWNKLKI